MAEVDDRVVAMSFESDQFNNGVNGTIGVIGRLKQALNFTGATRGLDDLQNAGSRVDLSHISSAVDTVGQHFSILAGAAAVALGGVASQAITAGATLVKALSLDPVMAGFHNYETQINAVQTILANTGLKGASGMGQVNAVLAQLNTYANQTVYNFSEMAKNIGTFTAAGVGLKQSEESIKGIANLAALSGSSSDQASSAMYQLSQAIAAGTVHLQDWNSVVNAGIGGGVFQKALFNTAKAMGTLTNVPVGETFEQWKAAGNSFRQSIGQTAQSGTKSVNSLAEAQKKAAETVAQAQQTAADSITQAAEQVKNAQQSVADAARQSAKDVQNAEQQVKDAEQGVGDAFRQAAKDIQNAEQQVKDAQKGVADANRQATSDIAHAVQQQRDAVKQSALDVQNALDNVTLARQRLADAMKPPSADELQAAQDKLTTSQLDQADLSDAVTRAQEEQTRAAQDLAAAQKQLADLQSSGTGTPQQILAAQRAVEDAQQRVTDSTDAQTRALLQQRAAARSVDQAQQDLQNTQNKGTDQDKNVQSAQDALTQALQQYRDAQIKGQRAIADAEKNTRDVRIKSSEAQITAEHNLTKAEQNLRDTRISAAESELKAEQQVTKAEQNLRDVRISSAESQAQAGQRLVDAERSQAKAIRDAQQNIAQAHEQAAQAIEAARAKINPKAPQSWLTAGVLTNTLQQFAGDLTAAQLKAQGFTDAQIKDIQAQGKSAEAAATNIKTITQLTQALKEEVATAWAAIFKTIFGNITQSTALFSKVHITLENALTNPLKDLNKVLQDWEKAGGRATLIDAFKHAWTDLSEVLHQVREAWREIFPAATGQDLVNITDKFDDLVKKLTPSVETLSDVRRIFAGIFAALDIGKTVIGDVIHILFGLVGAVAPAGGGFLSLAANVGDFLVHVDDLVKRGTLLTTFFGHLATDISSPAAMLHTIATAIIGLFSGFDSHSSGGISDAIGAITDKLPPLQKITNAVHDAWEKFLGLLQGAGPIFQPFIQGLGNLFGSLTTFISNSLQNMNFDAILHAIDTGLLGGIFILFKRFFSGGGLKDALGGGLFGGITEAVEGVTGALKAMQTTLKANALLQISIAIGLLAASLLVLSTIPAQKLNTSMSVLTIAMSELVGAMAILNKIGSGVFGAVRLGALAGGLILLSGAVLLLSVSVKELAELDWNQLEKGLTAVGVLLAEIAVAMGPISANSGGMIRAGLGITAIATAMVILAHAVGDFGGMDLPTLGKGLAAVGGALLVIGTATKTFPPGMIGIGLGLLAISGGMKILAGAISELGNLNSAALERGLLGLAGSLAAIALALHSMPPGLLIQGAGLLIVAEAIKGIASAVGDFGGMSMDTIAKGILALALALTVLGTALNLMEGALPGALALIVASGALAMLTPAIIALGHQDIGNLITGLGALAAAMTVMGVAGLLLEPVAPAMLALGVAMLAIGGGLALAGAGVFLVGTGLSAIAVSGPIAIGVLLAAFENFVLSIPKLATGIATAVLSVVTSFAKAAPEFVTALGQILVSLGNAIVKAAPAIAAAFGALIQNALVVLRNNFPDLIKTGLDMLVALLSGIEDHIGLVTTHAIGIITTFLGTMANHMPKIVTSGFSVLTHFLGGIADNIGHVIAAAFDVVTHFVGGVASNIGKIIGAGVNLLVHFVGAIASGELKMFTEGINLIVHFLSGVAGEIPRIVKGAANILATFISAVAKAALGLVDEGAKTVINFLNGVAGAIRKYEPQLWNAGWNIASAIIDGMVQGVEQIGPKIVNKIGDLISALPDKALKLLHISSPSRVFAGIGENIVLGLVQGITDNANAPVEAVQTMTDNMVSTMQAFPDAVANALDFKAPTITPVLDMSNLPTQGNLISGDVPAPDGPYFFRTIAGLQRALGSSISAPGQQDTSSGSGGESVGSAPGGVYLTQNNYSPAYLSAIDIYRQTNNLISQIPSSTYYSDASYFQKNPGG